MKVMAAPHNLSTSLEQIANFIREVNSHGCTVEVTMTLVLPPAPTFGPLPGALPAATDTSRLPAASVVEDRDNPGYLSRYE